MNGLTTAMPAVEGQMPSNDYKELSRRLLFVQPQELKPGRYCLFGTGGYARQLIDELDGRRGVDIVEVLEREELIDQGRLTEFCGKRVVPVGAGRGSVLLGASTAQFQYNQLVALAPHQQAYDGVFFVDPFIPLRKRSVPASRGKVIFYENGSGVDGHGRWTHNLIEYLNRQRFDVEIHAPLNVARLDDLTPDSQVLLWNGQASLFSSILGRLQEVGVQPTYMEVGFFPQEDYFYMDKKGVNQRCALMEDDLAWVGPQHLARLDEVRRKFLGGFSRKGADYVLVPLQVPTDTNVVNSSRFRNGMQEFIDHVCTTYGGRRIVFKEHPKDVNRGTYDFHGYETSDLSFVTLLERAAIVHGITSTTLYEAALAGVEVVSEGVSLLNTHRDRVQPLLAAIVDRQIPVDEIEMDYWIERYTNLRL